MWVSLLLHSSKFIEWCILWIKVMNRVLELIRVVKWMKESEVAQLCLILYHAMDCSLLSSTIHGVFQARVLERAATSFSRGSSQPRDRTQVSRIAGRRFNLWATREACKSAIIIHISLPFLASLPSSCPIPLGHPRAPDWAPCAAQQLLTSYPSYTQ